MAECVEVEDRNGYIAVHTRSQAYNEQVSIASKPNACHITLLFTSRFMQSAVSVHGRWLSIGFAIHDHIFW